MSWRAETQQHIHNVCKLIGIVRNELLFRGVVHDKTKLQAPESEFFERYTPKLKSTTYGSEEYKKYLELMQPGLDHHYEYNSHHPEYHTDGISGMTLVDVVEMLCDWVAATKRHDDGDILKSIEINTKRFEISDQLKSILLNTVSLLD